MSKLLSPFIDLHNRLRLIITFIPILVILFLLLTFAELNPFWRYNLGSLGLVMIIGLGLALVAGERFTLSQIKQLHLVVEQLTAGDLTARTQLLYKAGELGKLAHLLDQMADTWGQRHLGLQAEEALRQSEERYRMVSELTSDYAYVVRIQPDGYPICEWMTEAFERITGFSPDEVITGGHWSKFLHPDDMGIILERRACLGSGQAFVGEYRMIDKAGRFHWVRDHVQPIWDEAQGRLVGVYGAAQDITERKWAEEELLRRNRELILLNRVIATSAASLDTEVILDQVCRDLAYAFNTSQVIAVLLNKKKTEGTVVAEYRAEERFSVLNQTVPIANNRFYHYLLKYKAPLVIKDVRAEPNLNPLHAEMRQHGMVSLLIVPLLIENQVVGNLGVNTLEERTFSAEEISLAWSVADQVAGALARAWLVEEGRQLQEQYHQLQKMEMVGQLAAGIAHDFNNLLTAINGFAALLQDELPADDSRHELAGKILHSGQRAADLVWQLLAFSRKQIISPQKLNLNKHVMAMQNILERTIGENISLETLLRPDLWLIEMDPSQIEQVIVNLVVNARDAMSYGGCLTIETDNMFLDEEVSLPLEIESGDYVLLSISDTGVGMNEATRSHIFEPFFTTKEVGKGTGLGLATVFGIVKQNRGHIEVYSQEGEGTLFKIYLPRVYEAATQSVEAQAEENSPVGHETILLVEDDAGVRKLAEQVLQRQGYTILVAGNGQEALDLVSHYAGPIQLVLTDVVMPGISGGSLAEQLRQKQPELRILFMSGYTDNMLGNQGVLSPEVAFLQKPFSPSALARKIRTMLDS